MGKIKEEKTGFITAETFGLIHRASEIIGDIGHSTSRLAYLPCICGTVFTNPRTYTHTRNIAGTGRPSETHPAHSDLTVLTRQLVCVGFGLVFFLFTPVERIILEPTARGWSTTFITRHLRRISIQHCARPAERST